MKLLRKNKNGWFICEECNDSFSCRENLSKHIRTHNMSRKQYFDKWLKEDTDGICKECGKPTKFIKNYLIYCSDECHQKGHGKMHSLKFKIKRDIKKENYKFICEECNDKFETSLKLSKHIIKEHDLKIYYDKFIKKENEDKCKECGKPTEFYNSLKMGYRECCCKECTNKYRVKKIKESVNKTYGVDNVFQLKEIKEKSKNTCFKNHGVFNSTQNINIFNKQQISGFRIKYFKDTNISYRSSYELDFLEKYYSKYPDIINGPSIKYKYKNKSLYYFPDFYIPSLNLIIEIKSSRILKVQGVYKNKLKKDATINAGYKYKLIIDKNYKNFSY